MQGIECEPLLGARHRLVEAAVRGQLVDQPVERTSQLPPETVAATRCHVSKSGTVSHGEAREQLAAMQIDRRGQLVGTGRGVRGHSSELGHVKPRVVQIEGDRAPVGGQPFAAE